VGSTAEVKGSRAWLLPIVDFGVAIGLVVGFLFNVVLRKGRCLVGGGDHVSSCVGGRGGLDFVLVLEEESERESTRTTGGDGDVMYTWPCEPNSPHKHDRMPRSLRGCLLKGVVYVDSGQVAGSRRLESASRARILNIRSTYMPP
jgi:hypothetical protein